MVLNKARLLLVFGAVLSLVLAACGGGEEEAAPQPTATPRPTAAPTATAAPVSTGELNVTIVSANSFGLFPFPTNQQTPATVIDAMYDLVFQVTQNGKFDFPASFATSATANADSTVWTIKTRNGVVFQNGDPATAKDIVFAVGLVTGKDSRYTIGFDLAKVLTKMETPDDQTVVFTLSQPNIFFPHSYLSPLSNSVPHTLWPQKYVESVGVGEANKKPVGSGPYKFKSVVIGDRVVLEAVDKHWYYGVPRIKTLSVLQIPEESTRIALLKTGQADLSPVTSEQGAAPLGASGLRIFAGSGKYLNVFSHRVDAPLQSGDPNPLGNEDVRKALIWYAIDRSALAAAFFPVSGKLTLDFPIGPPDAAYDPNNRTPVPPYDPAKAKALLSQAGYPRGFQLDGYNWVPENAEPFEAIFVYWEQIGIKVNRIQILLPNFQALSIAANKEGWKRATVSGPSSQQQLQIAAYNEPLIGHNPAGPFHSSSGAEVTRLAAVYAASKSLDEYIQAGRAYQKYNAEHLTGWWPIIEVGALFALSNKLPKDWTPDRNGRLNTASAAASR